MNAKEAMQALLDGKIVTTSTCEWKLNGTGALIFKDTEGWAVSNNVLNRITGVIEEYPLTFEEALRAMLDGKVVEVERLDLKPRFSYRFNRELSCFEFYAISDGKWWMTHISECEQICKWKVVE